MFCSRKYIEAAHPKLLLFPNSYTVGEGIIYGANFSKSELQGEA
jgi:hypothetical protein